MSTAENRDSPGIVPASGVNFPLGSRAALWPRIQTLERIIE